ncbi:MaoC family dehydratase [Paramicrobacterium agarici]|uniref:MaoC dehydratase-like protein n=1 Tax=Paramicrobacterium agarici TaxID=630514 RepID=A0A2A9DT95_9MICO|nr:MaoC family dehydratase [Microbacterium agarici]PFG29918.1 MaoC dehydratase-like protein [Microbacterium agarici]
MIEEARWRDLTDPRRVPDLAIEQLESGRKDPMFENLVIPEDLGTVSEVVDDHKIKRYAFTQDEHHSWYMNDSPFGGRIGQPALLCNDLVQMFTNVYAASKVVGLHTEEEMWFDNPVRLDEVVTLSAGYTDAYERRNHGYVVMEARAVGDDGRSIVRHRGIEILRTMPGAVAGRGSTTSADRPVTGEVPASSREVATLEDARVGDVLTPLIRTVTFEQAAVFSRLGEYVTNIHNNLATAREGGLRQPIVQGAQQFGLFAQRLAHAFGASFFTTGWLRVKFLAPVNVFEPITISGIVTAINACDDGGQIALLDVWARNSAGRLTTVGWASAKLPTN